MITRRTALAGIGFAATLAAAGRASAQSASVSDLAVAGPLGDVWLGPDSAKVTIIEYASMTCTHCAHFHATTYPELKKRYIDTGLVHFTLREFPLDPLATAGFMLARCDGPTKYYPMTDLLFDQQERWAFVDKPVDALRQLVRQAGFSQEKFDSCLRDQKLYDAINTVKNRAVDVLKVDSTPTFFVNGQRVPGAISIDDLEKTIKPMLGA